MMVTSEKPTVDPGVNNPCPFLRALFTRGSIKKDYEKPQHLAEIIHTIASRGYSPTPDLSTYAISFVGSIANGIWPSQITQNILYGTHVSNLRGGLLDKKGGGSQILSENGIINQTQLDRMASFGSKKVDVNTGRNEMGLNLNEINSFIDANAQRSKEIPGAMSPRLGKIFAAQEYPVLLRVMGKPGKDGERYLSMDEVTRLWVDRELPSRFDEPQNSTRS